MLTYILCYLAACYLIGAVWFLLLERKDGFTKWRVLATVVSPIAVPLLLLAWTGIKGIDLFSNKQ